MFNFFLVIKPLVSLTRTLWDGDFDDDLGGSYHLGFITIDDPHNVGILLGIWLSVGFIYFIDLQVRFGHACDVAGLSSLS